MREFVFFLFPRIFLFSCSFGEWEVLKMSGDGVGYRANINTSVALIVQIHLLQNRADLAAKEAQRARKWAQDSLLVNLAESWVGMREVSYPIPLPSRLTPNPTPASLISYSSPTN